jgi:hypothetical protein
MLLIASIFFMVLICGLFAYLVYLERQRELREECAVEASKELR